MARLQGSRNRRTLEIQRRLDKLGFDPIKNMMRLSVKAEKEGDLALAGQMNKELAKYYAPQLKAVEVQAEVVQKPYDALSDEQLLDHARILGESLGISVDPGRDPETAH